MEKSEMSIVAHYMQKAPVDLRAIFRELGIDYEEAQFFGSESGWIERINGKYSITVNATESDVRRRFTAAHELAHYLLHRDLLNGAGRMNRHTDQLFDGPSETPGSPITRQHEVQANRLAAQIIMPAALIRAEWANCKDAATLAQKFRVSKAAMEIRLKTLGLA